MDVGCHKNMLIKMKYQIDIVELSLIYCDIIMIKIPVDICYLISLSENEICL